MKKKVLLIFMAALLLWTGMACASDEDPQGDLPQLELTLEELAAYDGKDGNPAYIAVDGVIYDVTDVSLERWRAQRLFRRPGSYRCNQKSIASRSGSFKRGPGRWGAC